MYPGRTNNKGFTFLEVIFAMAVGLAGIYAATSLYSSSLVQVTKLSVSASGNVVDEELKVFLASRIQGYLDSLGGASNPSVNRLDNYWNASSTALASGLEVELLDLDMQGIMEQSRLIPAGFEERARSNASYWSAYRRCTHGLDPLDSTVNILPIYRTGNPQSPLSDSAFGQSSEFYLCAWLNAPDTRTVLADSQPVFVEVKYTIRNSALTRPIKFSESALPAVDEVRATPALLDYVISKRAAGNGNGTISDSQIVAVLASLGGPAASASARQELSSKLKRSRMGNLSYTLHWMRSGDVNSSFGLAKVAFPFGG